MPSRNVVKQLSPQAYYHVYNRGVAKQAIFLDDRDKDYFLKVIARHLDPNDTSTKGDGTYYKKFDEEIELLCFCLMDNHFHMLVYVKDTPPAMASFMHCVLTAYSMYFNKRHERVGSLFQSVYKASWITNDAYLLHISRYIHLNPGEYQTYPYSSLPQYLRRDALPWLHPDRMLRLFNDVDYLSFLQDYESYTTTLFVTKLELAGG